MSGRDLLIVLWRTRSMFASLRICGAAVETLGVFVMLWASGIYLESFDPVALQPSLYSLCHDLGPVVRADMHSAAPHSRIAFCSRGSTAETLTIYRRIRIICSAVHRFFVVDDIPFFDRRKSSHLM